VTVVLTVVGAGRVLLSHSSAARTTDSPASAQTVSPPVGAPGTATAPGLASSAASPSAVTSPSAVRSTAAETSPAAPADPRVIGTGWRPVFPSSFIQFQSRGKITQYPFTQTHLVQAGASYDRAGGVETFKLFNNGASNRGEVRLKNEYTTGWRQFSGDVRISPPTDDECVMQIFGAHTSGAMMMVRAFSADGGTLKLMLMLNHSHQIIVTHIYGVWLHLNIVHDANANTVAVYVNGKLAGSSPVEAGNHYMKYGLYGSLRTATAQAEWRNVAIYTR